MKYKSAFVVTTFFCLVPSRLIGHDSHSIGLQFNWGNSPSVDLQLKLNDTYSAGIKVKIEDINFVAFYNLYNKYPQLTDKQKELVLENLNSLVKTQTALYVASENNNAKIKAQISKRNNEDPTLSLGYSHCINKKVDIKGNVLFHRNDTPEFTVGSRYITHDKTNITAQGSIKNNEFSHASLSCMHPITNNIGIKGIILFNKNDLTPHVNLSGHCITKNSAANSASVAAINAVLGISMILIKKEAQIHCPNQDLESAYTQHINIQLDEVTEALNKLKEKIS